MTANLENSAVATGLEKVSFIPVPKKGNVKECSNYHTIALISHANKIMHKILQARLEPSTCTKNFQMYKLDLEKAEETEIKLPTYMGHRKRKGTAKKKTIYFCFTDYTKAFNYVDHNKLWDILKEMGIPDPITCLLRNLYAGQEATFRTLHRTMNWFKVGKRVCQGCLLSPC